MAADGETHPKPMGVITFNQPLHWPPRHWVSDSTPQKRSGSPRVHSQYWGFVFAATEPPITLIIILLRVVTNAPE